MFLLTKMFHTNVCDRVFNTVIECRNFARYFTKKLFHYRPSNSNFKNSREKTLSFAAKSVITKSVISIVSGAFDSSNLLGTFRNFQNKSSAKHPLIFFITVKILDTNSVTLIKWLHNRPFPSRFSTISEHSKKTFLLKSRFWAASL